MTVSAQRAPGRAAIRMAGVGVLVGCTAGCVSLQSSGPVTPVTQGGVGYPQTQIWPSPPFAHEQPGELVAGFLQAARSGSANLPIANAYLTGSALQQWKSDQNSVIVVADGTETAPLPTPTSDASADQIPEGYGAAAANAENDAADPDSLTESVGGDVLGVLDAHAQYWAEAGTQQYTFDLAKTAQGYRISGLPQDFGVVLQQSEFESEYTEHDLFFANANTAETGRLIPEQVYLPATDTDQELATDLADLVAAGVPARLGGAATDGVVAARVLRVDFQSDDTIQVTLAGQACSDRQANCNTLALQLAASFATGLSSSKVGTVRVVDAGDGASGQTLEDVNFGAYYAYGIGPRSGKSGPVFVVTKDGQVERVGTGAFATGASPQPVQIGPAKSKFGSVAVQPGQAPLNLAVTSQDGSHLYIVNQLPYTGQLRSVFDGSDISSLSWDQAGDLWFTAVADGVTQVYRYSDGNYAQVAIEGLGGQVATVAAAPDSARVAVSYQSAGGGYSIAIGAASDPNGAWTLDFQGAETVADSWSLVRDFGWYDEDSLSVLGTPANTGSMRLYQLYADGSPVYDSLTQQPVEASPVTDTQDVCWNADGQPIASTEEGKLYELSVEGQDTQPLATAEELFSPSY